MPAIGADWQWLNGSPPSGDSGDSGYIIGTQAGAWVTVDSQTVDADPTAAQGQQPVFFPATGVAWLDPTGSKSVTDTRHASAQGADMEITVKNEARWRHIAYQTYFTYVSMIGTVEADGMCPNEQPPPNKTAQGRGMNGGLIYASLKNISATTQQCYGRLYVGSSYSGSPLQVHSPKNGRVETHFGDCYVKALWKPNNGLNGGWEIHRKIRLSTGRWEVEDANGKGVPQVFQLWLPHLSYSVPCYQFADPGNKVQGTVSLGSIQDVRSSNAWKGQNYLEAGVTNPGLTGEQQERDEKWTTQGAVYFFETIQP
jgi:hypothetical protein